MKTKKSFTLIELMVVISILGILATLISGNFINSLKKSRDARRKADLQSIQKGLEMYYEDKRSYPTSINFGASLSDPTSGKIYIPKIPNDPVSNNTYLYESDTNSYRLYSCIENNLDQGPGVNQNGYPGKNCGACGLCKFQVVSSNISP